MATAICSAAEFRKIYAGYADLWHLKTKRHIYGVDGDGRKLDGTFLPEEEKLGDLAQLPNLGAAP
jgi:hypothetical protein